MSADPEAGAGQLVVASGDEKPTGESPAITKPQKVPNALGGCRVCLFVMCVITAILMIFFIARMLWYNPFEPVFWAFIGSMIFYWVFSAALVGVSMKVYLLRNEEDNFKTCSKESFIREVKRPEFWFFIATLITSFSCMMLLLAFCLPEGFYPSSGLTLRRLASVTADSAALWIRDPTLGENAEVRLEYRINGTSDPFDLSTDSTTLNADGDYTGFVRLSGLTAATTYEVRFKQHPEDRLYFKTHPVPGSSNKFSFYFGSCFLHNFPYFQEAPGFGYVLDNLKPDLFMFIGDFIYADIPYFRGDDIESYKSLYRHALMNSHVQRALRTLPNYQMWDGTHLNQTPAIHQRRN
jgi:hypothetical protein